MLLRAASKGPRPISRRRIGLATACLAAAALCLAACHTSGGSSDDGGVTIDPNGLTNMEILTNLGLSLDQSDPVNANGETVTGSMNPLGGLVTRLITLNEISQIGATVAGYRYDMLDRVNSSLTRLSAYSPTESGSDAAWLSLPKKSVTGDMDGDGKDEVITAAFDGPNSTISFKWAGSSGTLHSVNLTSQDYMGDFGARSWLYDDFFMRDFTAADFDNDGCCEFALSCMDEVLILDEDLSVIGSFELADMGDNPIVRVEAGDLNGDSYADLVVIYGKYYDDSDAYCRYMIFAGSSSGLGIDEDESSPSSISVAADIVQSGSGKQFCSGEIVILDYDADGLNELAFAGIARNEGNTSDTSIYGGAYLHPYAAVWDPYDEDQKTWRRTYPDTSIYDFGAVTNGTSSCHPLNFYVPRMTVGDFVGDGRDRFLVGDVILQVNESSELELADDQPFGSHALNTFQNMIYDIAVAGDVTGDGCDDLVYMHFNTHPGKLGANYYHGERVNHIDELAVWGKNSSGTFAELHSYTVDSSDQFPTLALGDVDGDGVTVAYDRHEVTFASPKIIAVLCSPPYYPDIMEIGNSTTGYSLTSEETYTNSGNAGFYVGAKIGGGASWNGVASGTQWSFNVLATVESSFSWGWGTSTSKGTTITYEVNAGYDQVLFVGIPLDVYVYKILAAPSSVISANGQYLTISVPKKVSTGSLELSEYNSRVADEDKIPESIMNHTIGVPYSYYSKTEKEALEDEATDDGEVWLFSNGTAAVEQGYGTSSINTSTTTVTTNSFDFSLNIGLETNVSLGYFQFALEGGVQVGYSYEYEASDSTEVSGTVGSIPLASDWNAKRFNWGLMMIPKTFESQAFSFVTYWVEAP